MSKNSTLADSLVGDIKITQDETFKDLIRYKGIAAIIIKETIPEFKAMSLTDIAKHIVDVRRDSSRSSTNILEQEIDFLPSDIGTKDEKNTLFDAVFKLYRNDSTNSSIDRVCMKVIDSTYTINAEMQNVTSEGTLGYNIISRAIYYGATLLRDTVKAGDTKYTGIHKVYTIWLCANNLPDLVKDIADERVRHEYIHRYGIRRFYNSIPGQVVKAEKESDLMEVVLVELRKLGADTSEFNSLLRALFFDTHELVAKIETQEMVSLSKVRKDVSNMIDLERLSQKREETKGVSMLKSLIMKNGLLNKSVTEAKQEASKMIDFVDSEFEKAYNQLKAGE